MQKKAIFDVLHGSEYTSETFALSRIKTLVISKCQKIGVLCWYSVCDRRETNNYVKQKYCSYVKKQPFADVLYNRCP